MAEPIKRLHYFDHQFLREDDFTDEQEYHVGMRRHHNRLLHTWGIAEDLEVPDPPSGATGVTITQGRAIDIQGREIVLTENKSLELSGFPADAAVYVTIAYDEEQTDPTDETGAEGSTRWKEEPLLEASESPPAPADLGAKLVLARVSRTGTEVTGVDGSVRRAAGAVGGDLEVRSLALTDPDVISSQWPRMRLGAANRADVEGSLRVSGDLNVEGTIQGNIAGGAVGAGQLADNAVTTPKIANGAVTNTKIADNAVNAAKIADGSVGTPELADNAVNAAKIADGSVGSAELADNAVTIAKIADNAVNAAKIQDGSVGSAELADNAVTIAKIADNAVIAAKIADGNVGSAELADNAVTTNKIANSTVTGDKLNLGNTTGVYIGRPYTPPPPPPGTIIVLTSRYGLRADFLLAGGVAPTRFFASAALIGRSAVDGFPGVFATAPSGTHALDVAGTARITGGVVPGHIADHFINASGQTLRTGDIVKLKGTPITRFHGDSNKIPVAEVTLADKENDNAVIGIVDREAIPEQDGPDTRVGPEDPTFIENGGELFVVTLGAYAHCRVDATDAPIEVGDLLTTSNKPGHAKKATDPKIGAIIGKALEPLAKGTGYIAVFVNIQ